MRDFGCEEERGLGTPYRRTTAMKKSSEIERPMAKKEEIGETKSRIRPRRRVEETEGFRSGLTLAVAEVDGRSPPPLRRLPKKKSIGGGGVEARKRETAVVFMFPLL